jgi:sugar lactone lactonase YvrE
MKAGLLNSSLPACDLGEGPHWNSLDRKLYWVDITGKAIHRFDPQSEKHEIRVTPSMVGFVVTNGANKMIAGLQDGIYRLDFEAGDAEAIVRPHYAHADNRFNDGKCDPRGKLWAGTMNHADHQKPTGALYRLDGRGLHEQETGIHISNGLGWSPDHKTMYYTDTVRRLIWKYDYNIETATPSNRREFLKFDGKGRPDGMCVDSQGRILTALWPGWSIEIYTPDGKLDGKIDLPVPQVSSCVFGGDGLKTLYITTAKVGLGEQQLKEAPLSGQMFAVQMDVPGQPAAPFQG